MNKLKQIINKTDEPYRIFFPLGILGALIGAGIWIPAWLLQKQFSFLSPEILFFLPRNNYPIQEHILILFNLFLSPIVAGFALTAIPRFTATSPMKPAFVGVLFSLYLSLFVFFFLYSYPIFFYSFSFLFFFSLFYFTAKRYKASGFKFPGYLQVFLAGLFLGALGALFILLSLFLKNETFFAGKILIFYGMLPLIIIGIGTKLIIPVTQGQNPQVRMAWMQRAESIPPTHTLMMIVVFGLSFVFEIVALFHTDLEWVSIVCRASRLGALVFWFIRYFHILEFKSFSGRLSVTIYISIWMFLLGLLGHSFGGRYSAHYAHIYFISGVSLFIMSIMSRVVMSHAGKDLAYEKSSNIFLIFASLLIIAAFNRATAFFLPERTFSHLAYASIIFIVALLIWAFKIGKNIFEVPKD
ncbi:MAG: NnrS family protein [Leptospiraceae bacterium]|nr:NnrS family protein [Leptospiraceae bacterium]MCK6380226.1 NnrS family protein [Leptospiraceae bacterium]NUM41862.1 NnrS family protein [Leptospiraceae bacterium]